MVFYLGQEAGRDAGNLIQMAVLRGNVKGGRLGWAFYTGELFSGEAGNVLQLALFSSGV